MLVTPRTATPLVCALGLLSGCIVGDATPLEEEEDDVRDAIGAILEPRHGDVVSGIPAQLAIELSGLHSEPDHVIEIQILGNPGDLTTWSTIETTTTGDVFGAGGYAWQASITPGAAWPQGGLLRMRA